MIKFGSYDKAALKNSDEFHVYPTVDKKSWKVDKVTVFVLGKAVCGQYDDIEISS